MKSVFLDDIKVFAFNNEVVYSVIELILERKRMSKKIQETLTLYIVS